MKNKTGKSQPRKKRGAETNNRQRSYWHDMAVRYYLYLEKVYPRPSRKTSRYQMVRDCLDYVEGVKITRGGITSPPKWQTVKEALKGPLAKQLKAWRKVYAELAPEALMDFKSEYVETETKPGIIERVYIGPSSLDIEIAEEHFTAPDRDATTEAILTALAEQGIFQATTGRQRQYQDIAQRTITRLRALLSEAELAWYRMRVESEKAGVTVQAFPARSLITAAFADIT